MSSETGLEDMSLIDLFRSEVETHSEVLVRLSWRSNARRVTRHDRRNDACGALDQGGCSRCRRRCRRHCRSRHGGLLRRRAEGSDRTYTRGRRCPAAGGGPAGQDFGGDQGSQAGPRARVRRARSRARRRARRLCSVGRGHPEACRPRPRRRRPWSPGPGNESEAGIPHGTVTGGADAQRSDDLGPGNPRCGGRRGDPQAVRWPPSTRGCPRIRFDLTGTKDLDVQGLALLAAFPPSRQARPSCAGVEREFRPRWRRCSASRAWVRRSAFAGPAREVE